MGRVVKFEHRDVTKRQRLWVGEKASIDHVPLRRARAVDLEQLKPDRRPSMAPLVMVICLAAGAVLCALGFALHH